MNFKIAFAIIGVMLSLAASAWSQDMCIQVIVCDQYGNKYNTPCVFAAAQKKNPELVLTACP